MMFILVMLVLVLLVVIIIIAYRLRDLPGDGDPLVLSVTLLHGLLVALLHLLFGADLVRDMVTLLPRLIYTLLLPHILPRLGAFLLMNLLTHFFSCRPALLLVLSL